MVTTITPVGKVRIDVVSVKVEYRRWEEPADMIETALNEHYMAQGETVANCSIVSKETHVAEKRDDGYIWYSMTCEVEVRIASEEK